MCEEATRQLASSPGRADWSRHQRRAQWRNGGPAAERERLRILAAADPHRSHSEASSGSGTSRRRGWQRTEDPTATSECWPVRRHLVRCRDLPARERALQSPFSRTDLAERSCSGTSRAENHGVGRRPRGRRNHGGGSAADLHGVGRGDAPTRPENSGFHSRPVGARILLAYCSGCIRQWRMQERRRGDQFSYRPVRARIRCRQRSGQTRICGFGNVLNPRSNSGPGLRERGFS